jgi:hypothetical protein
MNWGIYRFRSVLTIFKLIIGILLTIRYAVTSMIAYITHGFISKSLAKGRLYHNIIGKEANTIAVIGVGTPRKQIVCV